MIIIFCAFIAGVIIPLFFAEYYPMNWIVAASCLTGCVAWWYFLLQRSQFVFKDYNTFLLNMKTLKEKRQTILEKFFKEVDAYKEYERNVLVEIAESTPMTSWLQTRYPTQIESASLLKSALHELKTIEDRINAYAQEADRRKMLLFEMKTDPFIGLCVHPQIRSLLNDSDYFDLNLDKTNTTSI